MSDIIWLIERLFILTLLSFIITAYIMNIIKLVDCDFEAPYKAEVLYSIGVVTPTFLYTGLFDIDDGKQG